MGGEEIEVGDNMINFLLEAVIFVFIIICCLV